MDLLSEISFVAGAPPFGCALPAGRRAESFDEIKGSNCCLSVPGRCVCHGGPREAINPSTASSLPASFFFLHYFFPPALPLYLSLPFLLFSSLPMHY